MTTAQAWLTRFLEHRIGDTPYAVVPHVWICAGGGESSTSLPLTKQRLLRPEQQHHEGGACCQCRALARTSGHDTSIPITARAYR
ncbi:hypothetical protein H6CHR_03492 [Variovorax sp. PBL-H6]|nr:hypothetical protein H6CHR_03492 [Variovorax sp. PBL-H6]